MQVTRRASKRRSGLRFWDRAPGIKANMRTPHTRQALTGATLWGLVVGMMVVGGAAVAFAHTGEVDTPTCTTLPSAEDFFGEDTNSDTDNIVALASTDLGAIALDNDGEAITPKQGDETATGEGHSDFYYSKITLPTLTAGRLMVTGNPGGAMRPVNAVLCGTSPAVSSIAVYDAAHRGVDTAANTAEAAQVAAQLAQGRANNADTLLRQSLSELRTDLQNAKSALTAAVTALVDADEDAVETRADTQKMEIDDVLDGGVLDDEREAAATALGNAADELEAIVTALRAAGDANHAGVDLTADLKADPEAGEHSYIVVVAIEETATIGTLTVRFEGIMTTDGKSPQGTLSQTERAITYALQSNVPGLFHARTTGTAVKTQGSVGTIEGNIENDNVSLLTPLAAATHSLEIRERSDADRGAFGLILTYGVAGFLGDAADYAIEVDIEQLDQELEAGRADYFFFTVANAAYGFLKVYTEKHAEATPATDTSGILYSQDGQIAMDLNSALDGRNFVLEAPIKTGSYILAVTGPAGKYVLKGDSVNTGATTVTFDTMTPVRRPSAALPTLTLDTAGAQDFMTLVVPNEVSGTLYVQAAADATGAKDTVGVLFDTTGMQVARSDNGVDMHFQITQPVTAGPYTLQVYGKAYATTGTYTLDIILVEDSLLMALNVDPSPEPLPTDPVELGMACEADPRYVLASLPPTQAQCDAEGYVRTVTRTVTVNTCSGGGGGGGSSASPSTCRTYSNAAVEDYKESLLVETDATGFLENPSGDSYRSGIGVISGWVCAANEIEVQISDGRRVIDSQKVGYGTSRPDVALAGACDHDNETVGFGLTYNFNHLDEGSYTIAAYADDTMIGLPQTFMVVHLVDFADADEDRFVDGLAGECAVQDFPAASDVTTLAWEQSIQNFVIEDVDMMEEGGDTEENTQ